MQLSTSIFSGAWIPELLAPVVVTPVDTLLCGLIAGVCTMLVMPNCALMQMQLMPHCAFNSEAAF
jgi:hypothetical protein